MILAAVPPAFVLPLFLRLGACRTRSRRILFVLALALTLPGCEKSDTSDKSGAPPTPASLKEVLGVIDLRTFPVMEGAINIHKSPVGTHFSIPQADKGKVVQAVEFYRANLAEAGWKPATDPKLWKVYEEGAQLVFVKQDFMLYASIGISRGDGNMNAGLFHLGNLDARRLPRVAGAEVINALPERIIYRTDAKPDAVKEFLRAELKKQGWMEFRQPLPSGVSRPANDRSLSFLNRAAAIDIFLTPQEGKTGVNASVRVLEDQLPVMPDAEGLEFDRSPLTLFYRSRRWPGGSSGFPSQRVHRTGLEATRRRREGRKNGSHGRL
jgi:hypothetical protein